MKYFGFTDVFSTVLCFLKSLLVVFEDCFRLFFTAEVWAADVNTTLIGTVLALYTLLVLGAFMWLSETFGIIEKYVFSNTRLPFWSSYQVLSNLLQFRPIFNKAIQP